MSCYLDVKKKEEKEEKKKKKKNKRENRDCSPEEMQQERAQTHINVKLGQPRTGTVQELVINHEPKSAVAQ